MHSSIGDKREVRSEGMPFLSLFSFLNRNPIDHNMSNSSSYLMCQQTEISGDLHLIENTPSQTQNTVKDQWQHMHYPNS